jgi:two-component system cell cycle sensor histidine kinase/response regulator CckA
MAVPSAGRAFAIDLSFAVVRFTFHFVDFTIAMTKTDAPRPYHSLRIVVVDDDELVRLPVVAMLQDDGATIFDYGTASQALRDLDGGAEIDLVLTDVNMPEMDGIAFAQEVARLRPDVPVIFMSGQARPQAARYFISKPFEQADLRRAVGAALAGRHASPAA